jgi:hypothetical protein
MDTDPNSAAVASASAEARQFGFVVDARAATATSAWHFLLIMRTNALRLLREKDHNINILE